MKKVYLLDTNIVSEFSKKRPNPKVVEEYELRKDFCAISSVTWQEMVHGLERMPEGKRKNYISECLEEVIQDLPVIPYDQFSANICGEFLGKMEQKGHPLPYSDTQIAATAIANGMVLVTHNTADFAPMVENSFLKLEDWFSE